jgi:hypothetical protein
MGALSQLLYLSGAILKTVAPYKKVEQVNVFSTIQAIGRYLPMIYLN